MGQKLKLDFTGVESFQRAAEGIHSVKIATAEVKQSSSGNDMIVVAFEVTKGVDKGARVFENFPIVDNSLWKLKGLLQAIGMKADGKLQLDTDKLIGKVCSINVKHEEYNGSLRARVESIMKFDAGSVDEDVDDDDFEDEDVEATEPEEEEEEKPAKKPAKKAAKQEEPEEDDDDDWDDDDSEEEEVEEPEEKPAKKGKVTKKEEKKPAKKSKKDEEPEDDDWDDDDDDWDEE